MTEKREKEEYTPRVVPNAVPIPKDAVITPDTGNSPVDESEDAD